MKNEIEFKKGDIVTFNPYEKKLKAVVVSVDVKSHLFDKNDDRIFYTLSGVGNTPLNSITTGLSIKESKYFKNN